MVDVYNLYIGGYLPKVPDKLNVHKKSELKKIYKNIRDNNKQSPLVMVRLSNDKQAYALDVKRIAMELKAATGETLDNADGTEVQEAALNDTVSIFNHLLKRSDEFAAKQGKPSRPGGELRNLVHSFKNELAESGFEIDSLNFLKAPKSLGKIPKGFLEALDKKSEYMSRNVAEYIDKKVCSYGFMNNKNIGSYYGESVYSGMLFNSYC
jgi:hypothetical protein